MSRSLLIGIVVTVLLFTGIAVFFYLNNIKEKGALAIEAVPNDAVLIFQTKDLESAWHNFSESVMWQDLKRNEELHQFNTRIEKIKSLIHLHDDFKDMLEENTAVVSLHNVLNRAAVFCAIEADEIWDAVKLGHFVAKEISGKSNQRFIDKIPVVDVYDALNVHLVTIAYFDRIIFISSEANLVDDGLRKLRYHLPNTTKGFEQVKLLAESTNEAKLYINHQRIPTFLNLFTKTEYANLFDFVKSFANWSMLDVKLNKELIKISGVTYTDDSVFQFLDLFKNQTPKPFKMYEVMPENTSFAFQMGFTDYLRFNAELNEYLQINKKFESYSDFTDSIQKRYDIDILQAVIPFIDGEAALAMMEPASSYYQEYLAAFIRFKDPVAMGNALKEFVRAMDKKGEADSVSFFHEGVEIERIKLGNFLKLYYGEMMENINSPYYAVLNDVFVFANSIHTLQTIISSYKSGNTLANHKKFQNYQTRLAKNNNVSIFISPAKNMMLPNMYVTDTFFSIINRAQFDFKKFEFVTIQFANTTNKAFYTTINYQFNEVNPNQIGQLWMTKLDTTFVIPPQVIYNSTIKENVIFVQDVNNTLYCLTVGGKELWRSKLKSQLTGKIISIDAKQDGTVCYLYSTQTQVNLIDAEGVSLPNYPINYPGKTYFPITFKDRFEADTNLGFFVSLDNNRIMGYHLNGKPLPGWNPKVIENKPAQPAALFLHGTNRLLYTMDVAGKLWLYNLKGLRVKVNLPLFAQYTIQVKSADTTKLIFDAIDTSGLVTRITFDSSKVVIDTSVVTQLRAFKQLSVKYDNLSRSKYIFTQDEFSYSLYDEHYKLIKTIENVDSTGVVYVVHNAQNQLGFYHVSTNQGKYYHYNLKGESANMEGAHGHSAFILDQIMFDKSLYVIGGERSGNLFLYLIKN